MLNELITLNEYWYELNLTEMEIGPIQMKIKKLFGMIEKQWKLKATGFWNVHTSYNATTNKVVQVERPQREAFP